MSEELVTVEDRTEDRALVDRAHELEQGIRRECLAVRTSGVRLGRFFHEAFEERAWELLGHESGQDGQKEWLASPEIRLSYSHAHNLSKVYGDVVIKGGIPEEQLEGVDLRELQIALPTIADGKGTIEEAIADAKVLGRRDFEERWKGDPNAAIDPGAEPARVQCPTCHSWVEADKFEEGSDAGAH